MDLATIKNNPAMTSIIVNIIGVMGIILVSQGVLIDSQWTTISTAILAIINVFLPSPLKSVSGNASETK